MKRISFDEALKMYDMDFFDLADLADTKRKSLHGKKTYFNSNRHINPTNVCKDVCKFCAYSASRKNPHQYTMEHEEIMETVKDAYALGITEVHIVSAHNPTAGLDWYMGALK
jgi:aminodeoxyfutalosine synthase